jgi:prevent-host-death family protein
MRTIEISTASKPLAEYTAEFEEGFVLLTSNNKPVAAVVSLKGIDAESLALSTNSEFLEIIEQARRECAQGHTISLSTLKQRFGV